MKTPSSLSILIEKFKTLPGIGEKTAERLVFTMLDFKKEDLDGFAQAIINVKNRVKRCSICNNITESDLCFICENERRDNDIICVVGDVKNVILFEKNSVFNGKYHVLDRLISPFDGIKPEDINLKLLLNRIKKEQIKEIVIALNPTFEGETTLLYLLKLLEEYDVVVSKIAQGIPMGADMEYLDALTLENALIERKKIS